MPGLPTTTFSLPSDVSPVLELLGFSSLVEVPPEFDLLGGNPMLESLLNEAWSRSISYGKLKLSACLLESWAFLCGKEGRDVLNTNKSLEVKLNTAEIASVPTRRGNSWLSLSSSLSPLSEMVE